MKKLAIFLAALLLFSMATVFTSAASLKNVAEGKTYTVEIVAGGDETPYGYNEDGSGFGDGPDAIRQRLTDGKFAAGDGGKAENSIAYVGAQKATELVYVIDLGATVSDIKKLTMDLYKNDSWGIAAPISVEYSISTDNQTYTSLGVVEANDDTKVEGVSWETWYMDLELDEAVSARYVKITAKAGNYVWSSEIQVLAESEETPDTGDNTVFVALALVVSVSSAALVLKKRRA